MVALAVTGVVVFGLAIGVRSWRLWIVGYCVIALAVTVFGFSEYQEERMSAQTSEIR